MVNLGEVRRAQLAKSTLLTSTLVPWDLFRSFKVCSDAKERVGCRNQWEATAPIQSLVKLQPWFLSLRWKACLWQNCSLGFCTCSEGPALHLMLKCILVLLSPHHISKYILICSLSLSIATFRSYPQMSFACVL